MKQISEEDRKRIEKTANEIYPDLIDHSWVGERIAFIHGAIAENAHLSETIRELEGVLGMAKAHMRDCTYSPQDLTQQENERFKHILDEIDRLLNQPKKP